MNKAILTHCRPAFRRKKDKKKAPPKGFAEAASAGASILDDYHAEEYDEKGWDEFLKGWHWIINLPTKEVYEEHLLTFQEKYKEMHHDEVGYLKTIWPFPFKERLVKAWVDQHMHFGNTATS